MVFKIPQIHDFQRPLVAGDIMVDDRNLERDTIGRKGGMASGSSVHRETAGQNVKQGWNDFKAKVRQKWNQLTDDDLDRYSSRNRNDLVGYVHGNVGGDRTLIERDIDTFARDTNYRWD